MITYVALLRGINVGGHNKVAMADLRRLCEDLGHGQVRSYVQSGNVVFTSDRRDADTVGAEMTERLTETLGVSPTVIMRTAEELAAVAAGNPYTREAEADPTKVHAVFLSRSPADPAVFAFDAEDYAPEQITTGAGVVYLHLPDGIGRSRLAADLGKRTAGPEGTVRNWRTVTKLLEIATSRECPTDGTSRG